MRVAATYHAVTVGRERAGIDRATIEREVREAVEAGRKAKTKPRFVTESNGRRPGNAGTQRFAWNEEQTRAYVLKPDDGGETWVVLTVLVPRRGSDRHA